MKTLFRIGLLLCVATTLFGQKPPIDTSTFSRWPRVGSPAISNDGKFVAYTIENVPVHSHTIIVKELSSDHQEQFPGCESVCFSADTKLFVYSKSDTLFKDNLAGSRSSFIPGVKSYKVLNTRDGLWIAYNRLDEPRKLYLENWSKDHLTEYSNADGFLFDEHFGKLLITRNFKGDSVHSLRLVDIDNLHENTIWRCDVGNESTNIDISRISIDSSGRRIAFIVDSGTLSGLERSVWYIDMRGGKHVSSPLIRVSNPDLMIDNGGVFFFNADGDKIFLQIRSHRKLVKLPDAASVDVWNYKDQDLQSAQSATEDRDYLAVINIENHKMIQLEHDYDRPINLWSINGKHKLKYVLAIRSNYYYEFWWNKEFSETPVLISTSDGSEKVVAPNSRDYLIDFTISPGEKYLVWYNTRDFGYYSYSIATGFTRKINSDIPFPMYDSEKDAFDSRMPFGVVGWASDDSFLLVYDRYDIWKIDPQQRIKPINITQGYGRKNHVVLAITEYLHDNIFYPNDTLLLAGFNRKTKQNGFFKLRLNSHGPIEAGAMNSYSYCIPRTVPDTKGRGTINEDISAGWPIKAEDANIYVVSRMSATESINYFYTTDFRKYIRISNVSPELHYNWLTCQLVHWKSSHGQSFQGLLYKPENFDSLKKYPVIFYYYEEKSDGLNMYIRPALSNATINIPYYVSNGYLVFVPDVYIKKGKVGESVVTSVVSAAHWLSKFKWVNASKFGIMGQSFGGYETNYLVTHTNMFAAACEGSGTSDLVSSYGQVAGVTGAGKGFSRFRGYELGQSDMAATPWGRPDLYVENSPVFYVNRAIAPLLMWHCKADMGVPFEQAIEMFVDMRRAGKKVWLLQYDGDGHATFGKNAIDLDVRMRQFFDYYLKDAPAPVWMTRGIPFALKQVNTGLEIDSSGQQP